MNADPAPTAKDVGIFRRGLVLYEKETGQSLMLWALVAALSLVTQITFRREMHPGDFGSFNTALGMIGLAIVPVVALKQTFTIYLARTHDSQPSERIDSLRRAESLATESFAWIWGAFSALSLLLILPLLDLPRYSLQLFTLLNVVIAVGGLVSWTLCQGSNQLRLWTGLLIGSTFARLVVGAGLTWKEPWAESGLTAFLLAGFITLIPALRSRATTMKSLGQALQSVRDRDFLLCLGSTFSVLLALCLFSSADRIVAQSGFGTATNNNMGLVNWDRFDAYQTAGLLARGLLWGTQPLLWILFAERSRVDRTRAATLTFFWIYLGALVSGAILLGCLARPLSWIFCGPDFQSTALFIPSLAAVMVPLGLLQALGIFSLASRRYHECFVLGGCSLGYTFLLYFVGRQPQLMPVYMFGAGLVCLTIVLFIGVVRWGRKQP